MAIDVELLKRFSADRALASQVLFADRHDQETPGFHIEIMDLWRSADEFLLIEAFREGGKTTLSEEFLALEGCFGNFPYALIIGETYTKACERIEAIDYVCRTNEALSGVFGGALLARKSVENKVFFASGAVLEAVGWEQELQSYKKRKHRPWRAYLDDVENLERVRDKVAVDASMRKLFLELIPALDKQHRKVRITQTRRAEDCMVTRLAGNPEWVYRAFPICNGEVDDPRTVALWPSRYPMEWIRREKAIYQGQGMLPEFLQAYMLQATDPGSKPFKADMLGAMETSPWHWMPRFAIYDPSRSTRERRVRDVGKVSDRTGKVVVSRLGAQILVHESGGYFWKPSEMIDDLFACQARHAPAKVAVEKNALDEWLLEPIRMEMLRRSVVLPLIALQAPQDRNKVEFIMGLQPFVEAGEIVLVGGQVAHAQLVAEVANFPHGPRDILNALAYALRLFGGVPMYEDFGGANIAEAPAARRGETVFVGCNASPNELVAVGCVREGRRLCVARDWSLAGALTDTARSVALELRAAFPQATFQVWVPSEVFDQWQRIPLVPALRQAGLTPMRGEHAALARGALSIRIRTVWRQGRELTVDRAATVVLNALAAGYALPPEKGGRTGSEPEAGVSRLAAEALECMVAMLDKTEEVGTIPKNANIGYTPAGRAYVTANPRAR